MIPKTPWIFRRINYWNGRARLDFASSRSPCTMLSLIGRLRARRGNSIFTIAPHPFYVVGGSIGSRLVAEIDCFDAIEYCHFHIGPFNPNRRAQRVATRFGKPMIATSDAHRLHAFGRHYTSMPIPPAFTVENVFAGLRSGPLRLTSPASSLKDFVSAIHFVFLAHPFRVRRKMAVPPHC